MADYWLFRRRGSTRWTFSWAPDPNNKQKRKQVLLPEEIKTEREAERYAELHEGDLKATQAKPRARGIVFADLVERWIKLREHDERFAASTVRDAHSALKTWVLNPVGSGADAVDLGQMTPERIDVPTLRRWVRALAAARSHRGAPLAPYSVRNVLRALTWLLDDIIGEGWATISGGNPARARAVQAELPDMQPLAGRSQKLRLQDAADAQKLLDCAHVPMERRVRYLIGLTSGLRDGEIAGLKWSDVGMESGVLHVRRGMQLRTRGGGAGLGRTKTRSSVRNIPLHPAACAALRDWQSVGWEIHVGHAPRPDDPVFATPDGAHYRPRSAEQFRADIGAAGLPTHVDGHALTFHAARRSFASWLRAAQVPPEVRQVLMGHVPKTAEEKHYSEEDPTVLAEHIVKIELVWKGMGHGGRSADRP